MEGLNEEEISQYYHYSNVSHITDCPAAGKVEAAHHLTFSRFDGASYVSCKLCKSPTYKNEGSLRWLDGA